MADDGSGVPVGCRKPIANDKAEYDDESAEVAPLAFPSIIVKLPDLECPLASLAPLAELPACDWGGGRPFGREMLSCGVALLPCGVANRNCGGMGREEGL